VSEERSLEGWRAVVGRDGSLADIVERAFDYRGDVTITRADGSTLSGYVYNRERRVADPYLELFDPAGGGHRVRYADIRAVAFTGKDPAAGTSYEAWLRRRAQDRAEAVPPPA
jgi:hypothetical protein